MALLAPFRLLMSRPNAPALSAGKMSLRLSPVVSIPNEAFVPEIPPPRLGMNRSSGAVVRNLQIVLTRYPPSHASDLRLGVGKVRYSAPVRMCVKSRPFGPKYWRLFQARLSDGLKRNSARVPLGADADSPRPSA